MRFAVQVGSPELLQMLLRAHRRRPGRGGPRRLGRLEGGNPHRPLPPHHAAAGRRQPGHHDRPALRAAAGRRSARALGGGGRRPLVRPPRRRLALRLPQRHVAAEQAAADLRLLHDLEPGGVRPTAHYRAGHGHRAVHRRHVGGSRPGHLPQADRGPDQPGPGDPLGADPHAGRRAGAGPLLGPRSGLTPASRRRIGWPRSSRRWSSRCCGPAARRRPSAAPGSPASRRKLSGPKPQTRVNTDNSTSDRYTIIDVFASTAPGLLYAVTRTLFELGFRSGGRRSAPTSTRWSTSST